VLGDLVSAMLPPPVSPPPIDPLPLVRDVESGFYIHMEVADRPGALAAVAQVLGEHGASIKSVVQRGLGEHARLVMVIHPLAESRVREALKRVAALDFLRSTPRAIRVIEEEFM
jgi:homoserine dehydrogenase